jgi:hypothetical protein
MKDLGNDRAKIRERGSEGPDEGAMRERPGGVRWRDQEVAVKGGPGNCSSSLKSRRIALSHK